MEITVINVQTSLSQPYRLALISDLHNQRAAHIIDDLSRKKPAFIIINGDLLYAAVRKHGIYDHVPGSGQHIANAQNALSFLHAASKTAPVVFSTGNHELYLNDQDRELLRQLGVHLLDDAYIRLGDLVFGGLSSTYRLFAGLGTAKSKAEHQRRWKMVFDGVNTGWLDEFEQQNGYKILLCHHPEFYEPFLKSRKGIDLILSGHAHGGQIRLFGRGLYAYGQGFLPKYTSGIYDNKLIVSRGLSNTSGIPRIGNPTELVYVDLMPKQLK